MAGPTTRVRDQALLKAFEAGVSMKDLASNYGMTVARVRDVIRSERHRRAVSPDPFYKNQRIRKAIE